MRLGNRMSNACGCSTCDESNPRPKNLCDDRRITSITKSGTDVIVTFNDCTFMRTSMSVVDDSVKEDILNRDELIAQINELRDKFKLLDDSMLAVTGVDGVEHYKVIGPTYPVEGK